MVRILVVHGPNLNLLGQRQPGIYGTARLEDINGRLQAWAAEHGVAIQIEQTNHEGVMIDLLQQSMGRADGVVINPGGYAHTSVALADAVRALAVPTVEVHLTNIFARDPIRRTSVVAEACTAVIAGLGGEGYVAACAALVEMAISGKAVTSGPQWTGGV
ncbi:MAG: type II 3-dehydroquinate dehydratase [Candidatus Eisenbacteria bacterium]|nr:type II 3-dehydroquinate dehydratase [Candidatus Eisenbacteria bacterium]